MKDLERTPAATIAPESFHLVYQFMRAGRVVRAVMPGLGFASPPSCAVIIDKLFWLGAINRAANVFGTNVDSGRGLEDIAFEAGENHVTSCRACSRPSS